MNMMYSKVFLWDFSWSTSWDRENIWVSPSSTTRSVGLWHHQPPLADQQDFPGSYHSLPENLFP